jgi:hypothetical protein
LDLVNMIRWFHDGAALVVVGADETDVGQAGNRENLNFYRIDPWDRRGPSGDERGAARI